MDDRLVTDGRTDGRTSNRHTARTFESVLRASGVSAWLLAPGSLADGLLDEPTATRSTAVLRLDDDRSMSLLHASAAAHVAVGPAAPPAHDTVYWPCSTSHRRSMRRHIALRIHQKCF